MHSTFNENIHINNNESESSTISDISKFKITKHKTQNKWTFDMTGTLKMIA